MQRLNEQILNGLIKTFAMIEPDNLNALGIEDKDMEVLQAPYVWTANHRSQSRRTLDLIMFGAMELAGLPQFRIPSEYIAASIACYVNPANWMIACYTMAASVTAEQIDSNDEQERVTPEKLFALVCMAKSEAVEDFRAKLEKRTKREIKKALELAGMDGSPKEAATARKS